MSHDFEPTEAEVEMLSHVKDIELNRKQTELGDIISGAILDGQNQIHDLYKEKATAQEVEYRMRRSYIYWMDKLNQELQKAREGAGKRNAVMKEYKDEGVMFILKVEDGKTYEASMPIPKWAEVGKLTLRDQSELDQPNK